MKSFLNSALMALILSSFAQRVSAQASLTTVDVPVLIDFSTTLSGVNNGPFAAMVPIGAIGPAVGQLDQNAWDYYFDGSAANAMGNAAGFPGSLPDGHGVQTGGALLTGVSAVDINGHRALAIQPAGNQWTSGNLSLRVANNTGVDVNQMQVSYKAYFFNDESRSNDLRFYYSLTDALGSFVEVMPAAVVSPVVPDTAADWVENLVSFTITGITLGAGYELYVRWVGNDVGGSGSRDEFALTDIGFTAQNTSVATLFSSVGGLPPFSQSVGTPSASQVFNISGAQLTADATLTVGAPFEISLDGSLFSTSLMVPQTGGSVPPTTIYARLNSAVVGSFNGTISVSSAGASTLLVLLSGNAVSTIGVDEYNAKPLLRAWPIPMNGSDLFFDRAVSGTVFNMDGRVVITFLNVRRIDLGVAPAGMYVLRTLDGYRLKIIRR